MNRPDCPTRRRLLRGIMGGLFLGSTNTLAWACTPAVDWVETDFIQYVNWDRTHWSAGIHPIRMHKLSTDDPSFRLAPKGDRFHAHASDYLQYYGKDNRKWHSILVAFTRVELFKVNEVKIAFLHSPADDRDQSHQSDGMLYLDWSGTAWEAKVHQIGVTGDPEGHSYLNLNWSIRRA
jgi:hypothetical protein